MTTEEFKDLVVVINTGFKQIKQRLDGIDQRLDSVDQRLDVVDQRLDGMDRRLDGVDQRLDGMDKKIDRIDTNLQSFREEQMRENRNTRLLFSQCFEHISDLKAKQEPAPLLRKHPAL